MDSIGWSPNTYHRFPRRRGGGGEPGPYVGELGTLREFYNKFELLCMVGEIFMTPKLSGKVWGLCFWQSERREQVVFHSIDEKIRKRLPVRTTRRCVLQSIRYFFFCS